MKMLKVAWICHFSNEEVRANIPLSSKRAHSDFAPWITNMIGEFEQVKEVELHVIAPHMGMTSLTAKFQKNGIHYWFFKPDLPFVHKRWPAYLPLDAWTGFIRNKLLVQSFLMRIKPNIINLHGAENAYYSATVLGIKKIPVYVSIQGIYSNPNRFNELTRPIQYRIQVERKIHRTFTYFGVFPPLFADLIARDNDHPVLLKHSYFPDINIAPSHVPEKKFDFIFFGRISDVKGVDKIILAVDAIKRKGRNTTLNIIGPHGGPFSVFLQELVDKNGLKDQVFFTGHLPTLQEVYDKAMEARVAVISSKFDNIPGTVIESVLLGIPVAATRVGGIPYLNKEGQTILLSEYGDIEGLANNMLTLLDNPEYARELTEKCRNLIISEFNGNNVVSRFIKQYKAILDHFHQHKPIDPELLFDRNNFEKQQ